jgi:hypothetical protein
MLPNGNHERWDLCTGPLQGEGAQGEGEDGAQAGLPDIRITISMVFPEREFLDNLTKDSSLLLHDIQSSFY